MAGLSDAELRRRLEAHNYTVPPITDTTRGLLVKKLAQLDGENQKATKGKSRKSASTSTSLIDYSSAEEEQSATRLDTVPSRRRTSTSSRNSNTSRHVLPSNHIPSTPSIRSTRNSSRSSTPQYSKISSTESRQTTNGATNNGHTRHPPQHALPFHRNVPSNGTPTSLNNARRSTRQKGLMHFSENEDDEESEEEGEEEESDEDEEEDVDEEDIEDDDEEELEDEHSYDEEEEDEDNFTRGVNLGIQTSPGLDDTVDSGNLNGGEGTRFRGVGGSGSSRFISSTPAPSVKSTSAYFSTPQPPLDSNLGVNGKGRPAFSLNSPLRRHVAGNEKAFGSLGEVLASLPMNPRSNPITSSLPTPSYSQALSFTSPTTSNNYVPPGSGPPVTAADLTTQVGRPSGHNSNAQNAVNVADGYNLNKRSTYCNSHNISKLIIVMAGFFFLVLSYKYTTLRPTIDIEKLVCETDVKELNSDDMMSVNVLQTCVPKELENAVTNITRDLVNILEARCVEFMCSEKAEEMNNSMSVSEILQTMTDIKTENEEKESKEEVKYSNEYDIRSNGFEEVQTDVVHKDKMEDDEDLDISVDSKDSSKYTESLAYPNILSKSLRSNMQLVLTLIRENPQWGIKIIRDTSQENLQPVTNERSINMDDEDEEQTDGENKPEKFDFDITYLSVTQPPINWECWIRLWAIYLYSLLLSLLVYLVYLSVVLLIGYGIYRFYCWRQEKLIREQQDVFELVEQVLSMLMTQHQQYHALTVAANANASQTGGVGNVPSKPCLAVNHIRDQLIPPTDRKRKRHIWDRVVKYIRVSESRVREDVQTIYGEEHLVWQWIPDIHWSPMTHHGPNPYPYSTPPHLQTTAPLTPSGGLVPAHGIAPSTPNFHHPHANAGSPHHTMMSPMPSNYKLPMSHPNSTSTPVPSPGGTPTWQGAAFNSLTRNVAAPTVAPTSCLKIRHMFDLHNVHQNTPSRSSSPKTNDGSNTGWIWQVKEEILRRCSATNPPASILHIAVDTESTEGCVYVKAQNTEEAGKVFRTLHGQWYRGNLVTVKYLREERYHERFPDAKHQRTPLRASVLHPL